MTETPIPSHQKGQNATNKKCQQQNAMLIATIKKKLTINFFLVSSDNYYGRTKFRKEKEKESANTRWTARQRNDGKNRGVNCHDNY